MDDSELYRDTYISLGEVIDRRHPRWEVVYHLKPQDGETVLRDVVIRPTDNGATPADGLLARLARDLVRPGFALEAHRAFLTQEVKWTRHLADLVVKDAEGAFVAYMESKGLPVPHDAEGWRKLLEATDELAGAWQHVPVVPTDRIERLARTAQLYLEARSNGHRAPSRHVAELQDRKPAAVRDDIHEARLEGLLTRTRGYGHPGGQLTPRALALLTEASK